MTERQLTHTSSPAHHPISQVQWVKRDSLTPNHYMGVRSPYETDLMILKQSILNTGWTSPIITTKNLVIVDGYSRYLIAKDEDVSALSGGLVPIIQIAGQYKQPAVMAATITHNTSFTYNRTVSLTSIIELLLHSEGKSKDWVATQLGVGVARLEQWLTTHRRRR